MIKIKSGDIYITVEDFSDLEARSRFVSQLNPQNKELEDVIGFYILKEMIPCGLTTCRTKHKNGYVAVTKDGIETNIGKDCGKTHFGLDFDIKKRAMKDAVTRQARQEAVLAFQFNSQELEEEIEELINQPFGAKFIQKLNSDLITRSRGWPDHIPVQLSKLIRARSGEITHSREATAREREILDAAKENGANPKADDGVEQDFTSGPVFISETIGELTGVEALFPENDLKYLLISGLSSQLKALNELDVDSLDTVELKKWYDWCNNAPATFEHAKRSLATGRKLHDPSNLEILTVIPADHVDKQSLGKKLKFHKATWKKVLSELPGQ